MTRVTTRKTGALGRPGMYEAVHARPDGEATVARLARTAADYGYEGVVVRNHGDARAEYDAEAVADEYGLDVVSAIEIRTDDAGQAGGLIGNYRSKVDVVCVHGGPLNRFTVEEPKVDVLAHPMRDGDVNHVLTKAAVENGVHLEFNLGRVVRADGGPRVQAIQDLRKLRELVEAHDAPFVVSADAASHLELRAPRELYAVGEAVGFDRETVEAGLRTWGELAERNRQRRSGTFIEPGVRIEEHEEDT